MLERKLMQFMNKISVDNHYKMRGWSHRYSINSFALAFLLEVLLSLYSGFIVLLIMCLARQMEDAIWLSVA